MENSYFQLNIERHLVKNKLTIMQLSKLLKVNDADLRNLIAKDIISISHPIIIKLSKFFNCSIYELFRKPKKDKNLSDVEQKLKYSFSKINVDLFFNDEKVAEAFAEN